jgi:hypothetical protein
MLEIRCTDMAWRKLAHRARTPLPREVMLIRREELFCTFDDDGVGGG